MGESNSFGGLCNLKKSHTRVMVCVDTDIHGKSSLIDIEDL